LVSKKDRKNVLDIQVQVTGKNNFKLYLSPMLL